MKRILFMILPAVFVLVAFRPLTSHVVTGKITDEQGNAIAGAKCSTVTGAGEACQAGGGIRCRIIKRDGTKIPST